MQQIDIISTRLNNIENFLDVKEYGGNMNLGYRIDYIADNKFDINVEKYATKYKI